MYWLFSIRLAELVLSPFVCSVANCKRKVYVALYVSKTAHPVIATAHPVIATAHPVATTANLRQQTLSGASTELLGEPQKTQTYSSIRFGEEVYETPGPSVKSVRMGRQISTYDEISRRK